MTKIIASVLLGLVVSGAVLLGSTPAQASTTTAEAQLQLDAIAEYLDRFSGPSTHAVLTPQEMQTIIDDGINWFIAAQEETGHFAYEYRPYNNEYVDDDNVVRQAGALFQLGELARHDSGYAQRLQDTIQQAIAYLESISREDDSEGKQMRCIVDQDRSNRCKLGATSLALIGMLGYIEAFPEEQVRYEELIEDYISYIKLAKKADGGFYYYYYIESGFDNEHESSFSNGEALLALVRYYQYNPTEAVRLIIDAAYTQLIQEPFDSGMYLWMMAALKDMQRLWPDPARAEYTKSYTDWRLASIQRLRNTDKNMCAYAEGLASAYSVLDPKDVAYRDLVREEINHWNSRNATLQIDQAKPYRVVAGESGVRLERLNNLSLAHGGFLTGARDLTQRIDFTQHCLSAYLQTVYDIENRSV